MGSNQRASFHKTQLENGITLIFERHEQVRSLSVGVWVKIGSAHEGPKLNGMSHFIEHMVFKGTQKRSALEIAAGLEAVGGDLNAFTDREYTCYHATILKKDLELALDLLSDIVFNPIFDKNEIEKERKILYQEMSMVEETPDEWLMDVCLSSIWQGEPLGFPVLGNRRTVKHITRSKMMHFFSEYYVPQNIVISAAGDCDFEELKKLCQKYFGIPSEQKNLPELRMPSKYQARHRSLVGDTEQLHVLVGFEGVGYKDPLRMEALILSFYLGGGMSSRLFQEVREKAALAYSVDCDCTSFSETGLFSVYAACSQRALPKLLEILKREFSLLLEAPISDKALDAVKGQLVGTILISSDQMEVRQEAIGRQEVICGQYHSVDEVIERIHSVTPQSMYEICQRIFNRTKESVHILGRRSLKAKKLGVL